MVLEKSLNFDAIQAAARLGTSKEAVLTPLIDGMNAYPGARPAFACFRAEVAADLDERDWLRRLIARLGLGHFAPATGETYHFVLMEYLAETVIASTAVARPFAVPTVLEAGNSAFFFPAPAGLGYGYTVDLAQTAGPSVREILHVRFKYEIAHIARVGSLSGPTPTLPLAAQRNAHLGRLRAASGRADYGETMPDAVVPLA